MTLPRFPAAHPGTIYRPDIDGLRTIAVMSVVLHHVWQGLIPGGFIGVDVFFVISGFLITSQVQREIEIGKFSLKQFYKRRINRIVPALLVVTMASAVAALAWLSPADLKLFSTSALLGLVGLSNIFFWREYGNYFAGDTAEAILLHTWSLGVEEQYYVLWPMILLLLGKLRPRAALVITVALIAATAVASQYAATLFASASYYLLPTRFFELAIGGALGLHLNQRPHGAVLPTWLRRSLIGGGLAAIAVPLMLLSKNSVFPGFNALYPCLGTAALILAGADRPTPGLASGPMVVVGRISYSLYLWHWPLIAFAHYRGLTLDGPVGGLLIAAAFGLSWSTWRYVELPMRATGQGQTFQQSLLRRLIVPCVVFAGFMVGVFRLDGLAWRFDPEVTRQEAMRAQRPEAQRGACHVPTALYARPLDAGCRLGSTEAPVTALLIGDSYANHYTGMLDVLARAEGLAIADYTMNGCPPIVASPAAQKDPHLQRCALRNQQAMALVAAAHYPRVILAAHWPEEESAYPRIHDTIAQIVGAGSQVTVVLDNPLIPRGAVCAMRNLMYRTSVDCSTPLVARPAYWQRLAADFPALRFIDPNTVICDTGRCNPVREGVLLYRDDGHLNAVGSRAIGAALLARRMGISGAATGQ